MNLQTFTPEKICIKKLVTAFSLIFIVVSSARADWQVDFSRRTNELHKNDLVKDRPANAKQEEGFFDFLFESGAPVQEMVVLNTEKGFIPSTLRVKEGYSYKISVVNVNQDQKNVSFVLDAFSEHHATYYGKIKTFHIKPRKEGIYSFVCPETSAQGRLVVYPGSQSQPGVDVRMPASE